MSEERIKRLLAPLKSEQVEPPDADTIYWRARVRLVLESDRQRRVEVLRPLRVLHLVLGFGSIAAAVALLPLSATIGLVAAPLLLGATTVGSLLLSQASPGRLG